MKKNLSANVVKERNSQRCKSECMYQVKNIFQGWGQGMIDAYPRRTLWNPDGRQSCLEHV